MGRLHKRRRLPRFDRLVANAEKGDAAAQVELGILYYEGLADSLLRPDYAKALEWFQSRSGSGRRKSAGSYWPDARLRKRSAGKTSRRRPIGIKLRRPKAEITMRGCSSAICTSGDWACRATRASRENGQGRRRQYHPDREPGQIRAVFALAVLAVIAFTFGLIALQRNSLTGWKHLVVAILVNVTGIALVLNTLTTDGFGIVFPHCSHSFLATDCTQISDPHTRAIVNQIGDFAVVKVISSFGLWPA